MPVAPAGTPPHYGEGSISIRAHLAEFGIVAPVGRKGVTDCCMLLPIRATGCLRLAVRAFPRLAMTRPQANADIGGMTAFDPTADILRWRC